MRLAILFLIFPLLATAQLKEFEVSEMERPDVAVVQANTQWLDDALLLVYSSLKDLNFRSSLGAIDKVGYNTQSNRYEVFFKPNKQMLFVYASNFVEHKIETFNPNPKDVFYYKIEEKKQEVISTELGTLTIITEPSGADVFVNGLQMVQKTPFEGELNPGGTRIKLQKAKHEIIDTLIAVKGGEPTVFSVEMKPTTLWVNISSTPSGASVTLDDTSYGTTPASFEIELADITKRGSKQLQLTLTDHEPVSTTVDLRPSATPREFKYSLQKETGSFSVNSTPEGAEVFIGGQYKGTTPLQGTMEVGQYDVGVKLENYFSPKQNIALSKNGSNEINFSMRDRLALPIAIGEAYGGGIVFELTEDGHGLVVAMDDLGEFTWQEAKRHCKSYAGGGFADWYLPSKKELKNLYKVFNEVNSSMGEEGGKKIQLRYYWSRTGDWRMNGNGHLNAWGCVFGSGNACGIHRKTHSYYVRPVRAF